MVAQKSLEKFKILIADADEKLAATLKRMLETMGFTDVVLTASGKDTLNLIQKTPFDFLILDWSLHDLDGVAIVDYIRCDPRSLNQTLPIIMLTGRAEPADVAKARDHGINEFVVKPFTAKTIYERLKNLVEFPREFIISENYVGPDRHRKNVALPAGTKDRRKTKLQPERRPWDAAPEANISSPKAWLPDFSLKQKLGHNVSLDSIITPAVLSRAQVAIDAISSDALQWIKEDLVILKAHFRELATPEFSKHKMGEAALRISSRAGTFGYTYASQVAYMLYLFCRNTLNPAEKSHHSIIRKYIDVLQLMLATNLREADDGMEHIIKDLRALTEKVV